MGRFTPEQRAWLDERIPSGKTSVAIAAEFGERFGRHLHQASVCQYARTYGIEPGWRRKPKGLAETTPKNATRRARAAWVAEHGPVPDGWCFVRCADGGTVAPRALMVTIRRERIGYGTLAQLDLALACARVYAEIAKRRRETHA